MAEAALAQPGDVIAKRYRVESWLGQGNMAIVYQAKHVNTGKACALKLVHPHLVARKEFVDLFVKEAQLGARIGDNPHIVSVFDAGVDEARRVPYLAMELLQGDTLEHWLKKHGRLPPKMAKTVFEHVADALDQAHAANVIHRDLKPGNLFISKDRKGNLLIKVMDFGIAKVLENQSQRTATQIGSPAYAAPEQLGATLRSLAASQGIAISQGVQASTDVWALGLVAYEAITGVVPGQYWGVDTYADLMICIALEDHPPASQRAGDTARYLPPGFDTWFSRCIQRDAANRWQSAGEAVRELSRLLDTWMARGSMPEMDLPVSSKAPKSTRAPMSMKAAPVAKPPTGSKAAQGAAKPAGPLRPAVSGVPLALQIKKAVGTDPTLVGQGQAKPATGPTPAPAPAPITAPAPAPAPAAVTAPSPVAVPTPTPTPIVAAAPEPVPADVPAKPAPPAKPPLPPGKPPPPPLRREPPPPPQKAAAPPIPPKERARLQDQALSLEKEGKWSELADVLRKLVEAEPSPERKGRHLYQLALLLSDRLNDAERAIEVLDEALDKAPAFIEPFERLISIHEGRRDWKKLERAYRKMLHRNAGTEDTALKHRLWRGLAEIYRDVFDNATAAIEAFQMAVRAAPKEASDSMALGDLCAHTGQLDEAIAAYQAALRADPALIDGYRQIYRLSLEGGAYDPAWCAAAALSFLREADEEQAQYFQDYRPEGRIQVKSRIDNELWLNSMYHEDESVLVGKVFEMVARAAMKAKMEALRSKGSLPALDPFMRHDPTTSSVPFVRAMGWASRVLGVQCPALFVRSDVPGGVAAVPSEPPSSVVGQSLLGGFSQEELAFIAGKHLAMYRPEHYIKLLFPSAEELLVIFHAAIKMGMPDAAAPHQVELRAEATAKVLRNFMGPQQLDSLRTIVRKMISEREEVNIAKHFRAIEHTAVRAGFVLTGDLTVAKKVIQAEPVLEDDPSPSDKLKDLLSYSVSESYLAVRAALGIGVGQEEG